MIKEAISTLVQNKDLTSETMETVMNEIMSGEATDSQKAAFLTALSIKGETIDEITAAGKIMREKCTPFHREGDALEIVGTGGDGSNTFNISTTASMIISAAGYKVAKHGNRAASSKCGAADCLEAMGVNINADVEKSEQLLKEMNLCFLFAQKYHTAMRYVGAVRKEIGIRTLFNILGPISNPARTNQMLFGVFSEDLLEPLAHVLYNLGVTRAMVVYGTDKMDEISLSAPTKVCEVRDGEFKSYTITPEQFGFQTCKKEDLLGGDPQENVEITKAILSGKQGPKFDVAVFNAGAAIYVADGGITLEEGIKKAKETVLSGKAKEQMEKFIAATNS
ncbi:MAG: anthranilate phosphoribosyltransferase [Clostridiaceae bacterium]|nr:anthranilate phosphoribosyltransferase [Clostridiaceae bacterium]